jgi:hypothetical protein
LRLPYKRPVNNGSAFEEFRLTLQNEPLLDRFWSRNSDDAVEEGQRRFPHSQRFTSPLPSPGQSAAKCPVHQNELTLFTPSLFVHPLLW